MITLHTLIQWFDLLWIPLSLLTMERGKKLMTAAFAGSCALLLRFQVELLQSIGFPKGFFGLIEAAPLLRGQIAYSFFIALFLALARFSRGADKNVYIAACITMMMSGFCISTLVMVL